MSEKKIAVIGHKGYVGKAMVELLWNHYQVFGKDIEKEDVYFKGSHVETRTVLRDNFAVVNDCHLAIVCVPTLQGEDGRADTSIVEEVVSKIEGPMILIKSTVPPGTTERLQRQYPNKVIAFSPEYIGEGKYYTAPWKYPHPTQVQHHTFMIVGAKNPEEAEAFFDFFIPVLGPEKEYIATTPKLAEMTKYAINTWGALKVSFFNMLFDAAEHYGESYVQLRELILKDSRIERHHTAVFRHKRGFGGKCFPKDVNGLFFALLDSGMEREKLDLLKTMIEFNEGISHDKENVKPIEH
jgi:UDPglucose 6-dehydrogenase